MWREDTIVEACLRILQIVRGIRQIVEVIVQLTVIWLLIGGPKFHLARFWTLHRPCNAASWHSCCTFQRLCSRSGVIPRLKHVDFGLLSGSDDLKAAFWWIFFHRRFLSIWMLTDARSLCLLTWFFSALLIRVPGGRLFWNGPTTVCLRQISRPRRLIFIVWDFVPTFFQVCLALVHWANRPRFGTHRA
jgi:hypothetical protein